ncbi:MAG: 16S rRNA (cytosine(967)-C(5))-methyltransferase RsmB [Steroidobacteraceae bacterium]
MNEAAARQPFAPGAQTLAAAARALSLIVKPGKTAEDALEAVRVAPTDRAAARAILLGSTRWYLRLAPAIAKLLDRPESRVEPLVHALLVVAAHQIEYSRSAPESVVNIAVDAARALGEPRAAGFVNALLRRMLRERVELFAAVDRSRAAATAHPNWFINTVQAAWGQRSEALLAANNAHPPLVLRVDASRGTRAEYLAELQAAEIDAFAPQWLDTAVVLREPRSVEDLPGFAEGRVSVQDAGAQLAAVFLDAQPGQRVLDACAAPGGKTGHILERTPDVELFAVDSDEARLGQVQGNLNRLNRHAQLVQADLRRDADWWDGRVFDRILLDAPCSSTGVLRRHPDIKLLRRQADLQSLGATQLEILARCFELLAPGGRLLYATCSVLPFENEQVVDKFLAAQRAARGVPLPDLSLPKFAVSTAHGLQLLPQLTSAPDQVTPDGFYYACLTR